MQHTMVFCSSRCSNKEKVMVDSDEGLLVTQNSFISAEIAESDVISDEDADIEQRFDRLLDNAEIQEQVGSLFLRPPDTRTNLR